MQSIDLFREAFPDTFDGKPVRLQVFKTGKWSHPSYGPIEITKADLATIVKNYETTARALVVDYDHGTDTGKTPEERKAAGWIKGLQIQEDGDSAALYAEVEATDEAYEYVKRGEYRFFSPTWTSDFTNKETGEPQGITLLRGAITNNPFIDGMHPAVALSERAAEMMAEPKKQEGPKREVKPITKYGRTVLLYEPDKGGLTQATEVVDV